MNLNGTFNERVIPCLEFTMEFQSNKLISKMNTQNDNRLFMFLFKTFMIEEDGIAKKIKVIESEWNKDP